MKLTNERGLRAGARRALAKGLVRVGLAEWGPIFESELEDLVPPRQLWTGPGDPLTHFLRWPWEYRAYLVLLGGMRRDSSVLELGCSNGRTMLGLLDYLQPPGRYEGLDILPRQVEFAQKQIHAKFPHFNFSLSDVRNGLYNPTGRLRAETVEFPYPARSFDVIYAASLFTHLLPHAASHYLEESRRVLGADGQCLFSFFILDSYRGSGTPTSPLYQFDHLLEGRDDVAIYDPANPEHVIAYKYSAIEHMAAGAGLKVQRVLTGYWSNAHNLSVNEQDLVLFEAV